jgi:hypothetical protein
LVRFTNKRQENKRSKDNYIKKANLKGYVLSSKIMSELKVGAVRLRRMFQDIGVGKDITLDQRITLIKHLQKIKDKLNEPKQTKEVDKTGFISNQELMQMFNFQRIKRLISLKREIDRLILEGVQLF